MRNDSMLRPRVSALLAQATKKPLTIVCAGMGCGKTRAVYDYTRENKVPVAWVQLTESDNIRPHFWELFARAIGKINRPLAAEYKKIGFPDSEDKLSMYFDIQRGKLKDAPSVYVFDDFHLLKDSVALKFMERFVNNIPDNVSVILISREQPNMNISRLMIKDSVSFINEAELNFTEYEISQLLIEQGLSGEISGLNRIFNDTKGWALLIGFVIRALKSAPGYLGYVSDAVKYDISQIVEIMVWNNISQNLKRFLLRLSLITHYSADLIDVLSGGDESLIPELMTYNAFIRYNAHMASWHIQPALLDFLSSKRDLLSDEEIYDTRKIAADWCSDNNFTVDALLYYDKIRDYARIASILFASQAQFISDNARLLFDIFENAPEVTYMSVEFFAALHIQVIFYARGTRKALDLAERYEFMYLSRPLSDGFRNISLGSVYYIQGFLRLVESTFSDRYDFDQYFAKQNACFGGLSIDAKCWYQHPTGLWTNLTGVSREGAPQDFTAAMARSSPLLQRCANGMTAGFVELCEGETLFYQGKVDEALACINQAIENAAKYDQNTITHRAMFYKARIAVYSGDFETFEKILNKMEELLVSDEDFTSVINNELSIAWFCRELNRPEAIPSWLKEGFSEYMHASTLENFGNAVKARYRYQTGDFGPLLSYMEEKKQRESILYERVEMLVMEACARFKMGEKTRALAALLQASDTAAPNKIIMPFIEFGRDTRALVIAADNEPDIPFGREWLDLVKKKTTAYARNQDFIINEYKKKNETAGKISLSAREKMILREMYEGLTNAEIASRLNLSINTVKMHIGGVYSKLGARNKAEIFLLAMEHGLLEN